MKRKSKRCECLATVNKKLEDEGYRVEYGVSLFTGIARPILETGRLPGKKRGHKPPLMACQFCPFCGKSYE